MKKVLGTIACLLFLSFPIAAQNGSSWEASQELVAKLSKERNGINYNEHQVPEYTLRDPLLAKYVYGFCR